MKAYLKFLSRNKLYAAIMAAGLIVSLALVIIIGLSVWDQVRIARTVPGGRNLYLLGAQADPSIEYRNAEALKALPEIQAIAAFQLTRLTVEAGDMNQQMPILMADAQFLDMLGVEVLSGSPEALRAGRGVALTRSSAERLFPGDEPVGKTISVGAEGYESYGENVREQVEVVAVLEDPDRTILKAYDVFLPFESRLRPTKEIMESDLRERGSGFTVSAFADLTPGADLEAFSEKYLPLAGFHLNKEDKEGLMATPFRDLYFSTLRVPAIKQGNRLYLYVLIILGLVLLLSAILNYMNLSSAIFGGRAKEMATRRLLGDSRSRVFWRIIGESLLFTLVCYVLAVLLAVAVVPFLDRLRPEGLPVGFRVAPTPGFWILSLLLVLSVGCAANLIPASLLSSYKPVEVLSGNLRRRRKMGFNQACIVIQSVLAIVLICMSITLKAQLNHLERLDIGISPQEHLFYYHPEHFFSGNMQPLADKLAAMPQIRRIGYTDGIPTHIRSLGSGRSRSMLTVIRCDTTAFRMLGFRIRETFSAVKPGTFWMTGELQNFSGVGRDNPDLSLVYPFSQGTVSEIGGVIEDIKRLAENADDVYARYGLTIIPAVAIPFSAENLTGILLQTGPDHKAFKREFARVVTEHFAGIGVPDLTISEYNQVGYLDEIIAADYASLHRFVQIVSLFGLVAVFLAMLGLVAISTWFADQNSKGIAIRKVFGSDVRSETWRTLRFYMLLTMVAVIIGIPVAVQLIRRFLEGYAERIGGYGWILVAAVAISVAVSVAAVLWQTLKAAKTNPAVELKKE